MIRIITWIDTDGPTLYEAKRSEDNPAAWTLMRLDVFAQHEPESIPGELLLTDASLPDVYKALERVLEHVEPPDDDG